jgi:hypothetical protein
LLSPSPTGSVARITSSLDALFSVANGTPDAANATPNAEPMAEEEQPAHVATAIVAPEAPLPRKRRTGSRHASARNSIDLGYMDPTVAHLSAAAEANESMSRDGSDEEYVDASSAAALRKQQRRAQRRAEKNALLKQAQVQESRVIIAIDEAEFPTAAPVAASLVKHKRAHSSLLSPSSELSPRGSVIASDATVSPDSKKAKTSATVANVMTATAVAVDMHGPIASAPMAALAVPHAHYAHMHTGGAPVQATVLMLSPPSSLPVSRVASAVPTPAGSKTVSPVPLCAPIPASIPFGMPPVVAATVVPAQAVTLAMVQDAVPALLTASDSGLVSRQLESPSSSASSVVALPVSRGSGSGTGNDSPSSGDSGDLAMMPPAASSPMWMEEMTHAEPQALMSKQQVHPAVDRSESNSSNEAAAMGFAAALAKHAHALPSGSCHSTDATPMVSAAPTPTMSSSQSGNSQFECASPQPPQPPAALPVAMAAAAAAAAAAVDAKQHSMLQAQQQAHQFLLHQQRLTALLESDPHNVDLQSQLETLRQQYMLFMNQQLRLFQAGTDAAQMNGQQHDSEWNKQQQQQQHMQWQMMQQPHGGQQQ